MVKGVRLQLDGDGSVRGMPRGAAAFEARQVVAGSADAPTRSFGDAAGSHGGRP